MTIEEIKKEAKKYHTGWGDFRDNAPVQAFELGAKWAYNRAIEDVQKSLNKSKDEVRYDLSALKI